MSNISTSVFTTVSMQPGANDSSQQSQIPAHIMLYLDHCRISKRLSAQSMKAYTTDMLQFQQFMSSVHPELIESSQITKPLLQEYLSTMNHQFAVKTVKRKLACLRSFFNFLEEDELIEDNPFLKLHIKLKEPFTLPTVMSLREIKKVLTSAYNDPDATSDFLYHRDIAVLELLFATGLRVHELCNLKYSDLNMPRSFLKIIGKGCKERHIYIGNEEVIVALKKYMKQVKLHKLQSDYIFLNKFGVKLSTQAARNIVTKYTHLAGIKRRITPHSFRHTFATLLLEEGVDIKYIQEFLGHSSISTTQIYLHISERSCRSVLNKKHPRKKLTFSAMG